MKRFAVAGLAALTLLTAGCRSKKGAETEKDTATLVSVETAKTSMVPQIVELTGTILPYQQNTISSSMPGRIENILVDVGSRVRTGQALVKMDGTQYRQTTIQLAQLELDYKRMEAVYQANGISKQQLDAQLAQVEIARETAKNLLENIDLLSPLNGVVTARNFDPGDLYNGAVGILTVMQIDRLKVEVNVNEQLFTSVKIGMPAEIRLDLYPDGVFEGKVSLIHPAVDAATRTFTVEITIENRNLLLRPGMFSRVTLNFGEQERVMLPDIALQKQMGSNERYVFVIEDGIARRRTVQVGRQIDAYIEVISGVNAGDEIAVAGMSRLLEGSAVRLTDE